MLNPVRITPSHGANILKTTGQLMLIPSENTLHYRPVWCDIDFSTFSKINNSKSKCFYEIISSKNLLSVKESINNINFKRKINMNGEFEKLFEEIMENENLFSEEKITDKSSLLEYAKTLGEKAFGDDMDEKKIKDMVDNAIEKATKDDETDWEAAAGIIQSSI
jgi:GTPase Era involved in 16S rRNA processing